MRKLIVIALAAACAGPVSAQQKKESGNAAFDALDRNGDGVLSREELAADNELAKRFSRFDANRNGSWDANEYVTANRDNDGRVLADTAVTTKVKALLLAEKGIPSTAISVETYEGRVLLSGFVESETVRSKSGKVAAGVSGVKRVQNNLVVK
ncbi:MAG: BON domain-containing protein [Betaproteobacteria bacterium]